MFFLLSQITTLLLLPLRNVFFPCHTTRFFEVLQSAQILVQGATSGGASGNTGNRLRQTPDFEKPGNVNMMETDLETV